MSARLSRNILLSLAVWTSFAWAAELDQVTTPPEGLDAFYKQCIDVDGMLVLGSEKVSPVALREVAYLARKMLANRPDVLKEFARRKRNISVIACTEMQTDLPDCRGLSPWWDFRARGLAGSLISCGEENLLSFRGDPWEGENIFVHEFGHAIHGMIASMDKPFGKRLQAVYDKARQSGRFRGYAMASVGEFWAEGVQAWFNCNAAVRPKSGGGQSSFEAVDPRGRHVCHVTKREHVKRHLPDLARLIDESFGRNPWTYVPVAKRLDEPHLKGYDPAKAPTFRWPAKVIAAFEKEEAARAAKAIAWAKVSPEQKAAAKKLGVPVAFVNAIGMRFVLIPSGTFVMGSRDSAAEVARLCRMPNAQPGWFQDEQPRHKVTLTQAFYMAVHEVTQEQYETVVTPKGKKKPTDDTPAEFKGKNKPVGMVSRVDAETFCKNLGRSDGRTYTLPSEAQWEYACRAGSDTPFSFGETVSTDQANYHGGYIYADGRKGEHRGHPLPVGSLPPNAWGLYDMHGNVSEWCGGAYRTYTADAVTDPQDPADKRSGVLRGGSWRSYPGACRSAFRMYCDVRVHNVGFRVACVLAAKPDDGN